MAYKFKHIPTGQHMGTWNDKDGTFKLTPVEPPDGPQECKCPPESLDLPDWVKLSPRDMRAKGRSDMARRELNKRPPIPDDIGTFHAPDELGTMPHMVSSRILGRQGMGRPPIPRVGSFIGETICIGTAHIIVVAMAAHPCGKINRYKVVSSFKRYATWNGVEWIPAKSHENVGGFRPLKARPSHPAPRINPAKEARARIYRNWGKMGHPDINPPDMTPRVRVPKTWL